MNLFEQSKIFKKKRENFKTRPLPSSSSSNTFDLQEQYNTVLEKYKIANIELNKSIKIQNGIMLSTGTNISNPNNPAIAYVTGQNTVKSYANMETYNNTVGKNGCPNNTQTTTVPFYNYSYGEYTNSDPNFKIGSFMKSGQSCGNEGRNIYVNSIKNSPSYSYEGCYKTNDTVLGKMLGLFDFEGCKNAAASYGFKYFGLGGESGTMCVGSNDDMKNLGKGIENELIKFRQLNRMELHPDDKFSFYIKNTGEMELKTNSKRYSSGPRIDGVPFGQNTRLAKCLNGTINSVVATYGGNCGKEIGNVTEKVNEQLSKGGEDGYYLLPVSNSSYGDLAPGCQKSFGITYKCADSPFNFYNEKAEGTTVSLDCRPYKCKFYLALMDNGKFILFNEKDENGNSPTFLNGNIVESDKYIFNDFNVSLLYSFPIENPEIINEKYKASNNIFGRNYMTSDDILISDANTDNWLSSPNGNLVFKFDTNNFKGYVETYWETDYTMAFLSLFKTKVTQMCNASKTDPAILLGSSGANAIYNITDELYPNNLGKIGYVNDDSVLLEYPAEMVNYDYKLLSEGKGGTNLGYNKLDDYTGVGLSLDECKRKCTDDNKCNQIFYDSVGTNCATLHNTDSYADKNILLPINGNIYEKTVKVNNSNGCSKTINNIDAMQWENYVKSSESMTPDYQCGLAKNIDDQMKNIQELQEELNNLSEKIITETEERKSKINDNTFITKENGLQFAKNMNQYNSMKKATESFSNIQNILEDSNIVLTQQLYSYIFWSILAIIIIYILIKVLYKTNI
jgi:hypothetical protein